MNTNSYKIYTMQYESTNYYQKNKSLNYAQIACRGSRLVRVTGLEPAHCKAQEPKSCVSANFTTPANKM